MINICICIRNSVNRSHDLRGFGKVKSIQITITKNVKPEDHNRKISDGKHVNNKSLIAFLD